MLPVFSNMLSINLGESHTLTITREEDYYAESFAQICLKHVPHI